MAFLAYDTRWRIATSRIQIGRETSSIEGEMAKLAPDL
jgi:hypothetical protein